MKRVISVILIIGMALSFSACSKLGALFSRNSEQSFSYPITQMPKTIDPQIASSEAELIIIENCMEGLVRLNSAGEIVPAVAGSWDISSNGLEYTFHLNPNAKWLVDEDFPIEGFNPAITAHDFVFAVRRAVSYDTGAADFQSVSLIKNALSLHASSGQSMASLGIKALDDYTLKITLEAPNSEFLNVLTGAVFMPCNEQFFDYCAGRYGRQSAYFLSNGGFYLRAWGETNVVLRKNDSYALPNPAKADSVTLYRDENAFESFKNNNYDALAVSDDYIVQALADTSLHVQSYDDTVWVLALNCAGDMCASKQLRSALLHGIESKELTSPDWVQKADGIVPNICKAGGTNYRQSVERVGMKYAPQTATRQFAAFSDEYLEKNDLDVLPVFHLLCTEAFEACAKEIAQSWQMLFGTGFEAVIEPLSLEEMQERVAQGDYHAVIVPLSADTTDASVFLKRFSAENDFGYNSAAYLKAVQSFASETDKCYRCEKMLVSDAVFYPLFTSNSYYVQRSNIQGIYFYAFGGKVNFLNAERVNG